MLIPPQALTSLLVLAANTARRAGNSTPSVLSPYNAVEFDIGLVDLPIAAKNEDINNLNRSCVRKEEKSPSPRNDVAGKPDIKGNNLIDAGARKTVADLNGCKIRLGNGSVRSAEEKVDTV